MDTYKQLNAVLIFLSGSEKREYDLGDFPKAFQVPTSLLRWQIPRESKFLKYIKPPPTRKLKFSPQQ
jgi:hypothetical protein